MPRFSRQNVLSLVPIALLNRLRLRIRNYSKIGLRTRAVRCHLLHCQFVIVQSTELYFEVSVSKYFKIWHPEQHCAVFLRVLTK